jgi:hypothetical protein
VRYTTWWLVCLEVVLKVNANVTFSKAATLTSTPTSATPLAIATQQDNLFPMQRDIDELVCAGGAIGCRQQGSHSIAQQ